MSQTADVDLGAMPHWDLRDLYPAVDAPELARDLDAAARDARKFKKQYAGKVKRLSGAQFAAAIATYERMQERLYRLGAYSYLLYATDMDNAKVAQFYQNTREKLTDIGSDLLFFTLEINRLDEARLKKLKTHKGVKRYVPWIRGIRLYRKYQLADDLERLLHDKDVAGRGAWTRLFDEGVGALRTEIGGKSLTNEQALNLLSNRDGTVRRDAGRALGKTYAANIRTFALALNTLMKDKEIEDRWRGYPSPMAARHLANEVEAEVVDALQKAVKAAYPKLSHRFYALKAKWLGKDKLDIWDRNAPLPEDDDHLYGWDEAKVVVLSAYKRFSKELGAIGQRFFDNAWIDAPVKAGKTGGAFAHPTVPSVHPYLMLNYMGKTRDVMTLAHELGHGVHNILAAPNGVLMAGSPLTLAETASVFGEQLTFRALLEAEQDKRRRRVMLAGKAESMINTVIRQMAFYEFEQKIHVERRGGELTAERIGEIWMQVMSESLGPAFRFEDGFKNFWCYVLHFVHSPFYVYAYAFGDCLVNSLYAVYQQKPDGFEAKYLDMLRAGGTLQHKQLLKPFGLDASAPDFWDKGLSVISGFIDELEAAS